MGRGRTGWGLIKKTHVTLKTEIINFENMINEAKTETQKKKWLERQQLVKKLLEHGRPAARVGYLERKSQLRKQRRMNNNV